MRSYTRYVTYAAIIAAMYAALTHLQNLLLPGSATWAIQFRVSEALCVLSFFTPAAIPGLSIGCFIFNLTYSGALPLDALLGTCATALCCLGMWHGRKHPIPMLALPALTNAILVGYELSIYIGGAFWLNALYVAIGELVVLYTLGLLLLGVLKKNGTGRRIFGE